MDITKNQIKKPFIFLYNFYIIMKNNFFPQVIRKLSPHKKTELCY
jgi:hypothetical protein